MHKDKRDLFRQRPAESREPRIAAQLRVSGLSPPDAEKDSYENWRVGR